LQAERAGDDEAKDLPPPEENRRLLLAGIIP
jgi:hypothetical protein